jgi:hypothetical protein
VSCERSDFTTTTMRYRAISIAVAIFLALGCRDAALAADLTTVTCRDHEDPSVGATLVFDLARRRLISSSGIGDTILFHDRDVMVAVSPAAIEWEVAHNAYTLNRVTLELDVIGRVYVCQPAKRQF